MNQQACPRRAGVALVIVLMMLMILSVLLVTFMFMMRTDRTASKSYSHSMRADEIARGALELVVSDLLQEIKAGSSEAKTGESSIYIPNSEASLPPARYALKEKEPNLLQWSTQDSAVRDPAYASASYNPESLPQNYASPVSTKDRSNSGGFISPLRWNAPQLLRNPEAAPSPDWILVTKQGPKQFNAPTPSMSERNSAEYVLGRYAYRVYDESALLDLNVAGRPLNGPEAQSKEIGRKAGSCFADLRSIPGMSEPAINALINWRNAASAPEYSRVQIEARAPNGFNGVYHTAEKSDNTFLSRGDLIRFAEKHEFSDALPYFSTHTREMNSPSIPEGNNPELNPHFAKLLVNEKPIRRFALSRFQLLETNPATLTPQQKEDIEKFFGLTPATGSSSSSRIWTYRASTIGTPEAAIAQDREPDLFELVKAAIVNASLGSSLPNNGIIRDIGTSGEAPYPPEANVHHQVARIIANLLDQSDADNFPTTIMMGDTECYGIESLPYFSEMCFKTNFPGADRFFSGQGAAYVYFELWNPHSGPIPANGPQEVRIVMNAGARCGVGFVYYPYTGPSPEISINSSESAYPPTKPFPSADINVTNLASYQATPKFVANSADDTYDTSLNPPVNAWRVIEANRAPPETWRQYLNTPPASQVNSDIYTNLHISNLCPVLQFKGTDGQWHNYATFAGNHADDGATGVHDNGNGVYMNNSNATRGNNNNTADPNLTIPKPDPRSFRYRTGIAVFASPNATMSYYKSWFLGVEEGGQPLSNHWPKTGALPKERHPAFFFRNISEAVSDLDGVARYGDGYLSDKDFPANPMTGDAGNPARPVILNRPFRSVAELGYVFRDGPWRSLDFFSPKSGDSALLDLFALEDAEVVAGRVSLNGSNPEPFQALLAGTSRDENGANAISDTDAATIATHLTTHTGSSPFLNRAMLATALFPPSPTALYPAVKSQREAVTRALAPATQSRTWNLLIDLAAQSGRYPPGAANLAGFVVEAERRYWLHVAIDRFTGRIVESQLEAAYESE